MLYNGGEGRGKGEGGLWEGEHLDNVNSGIKAALADKPHPKFGNLKFWKKKTQKKLRKSKVESSERCLTRTQFMHCFFKFLGRINPCINSQTFKTENSKTHL